MSSLANWSYTAAATVWPLLGRADWDGTLTFGEPSSFACDYSAEAQRMTDQKGVEFVSRQILYTERADIKQGDRVMLGVSSNPDPLAIGALEVRDVMRWSDTFDRVADDFRVAT